MASGKKRLSVSLLSSGRAETVERCLSSLVPLKKELGAEIVIVDTDPEHRRDVRAVLEKYADRIIPFEWCDDFAAARNAGLTECTGEWFFYIDDDEWLLDAKPVIDFLKSSRRRNYDAAQCSIRNFTDVGLTQYNDTYVMRLLRLDRDAAFHGQVHEYLMPVARRTAVLPAMIGHTGYVFISEKQKREHAARNIPLLDRMAEKEPDNPRWPYHLMLEYDNTGELGRVREVCERGIAMLENDRSEEAANFRGIFITERLRIERIEERTDAEEALYRKYRGMAVGTAADAYLDMEGARIYYILGDYGKSRRLCESYLKKWRRWRNRTEELGDSAMFFLSAAFKPNIHGVVTDILEQMEETGSKAGHKKGNRRMKESKPQLTVSLLSSGRSGTIERCLASLAPLEEQLDTEIIVVDTDPEHREDVRMILAKYADRIIPFEWCDDFSKARNAGLKEAKGEWFLFIDDDEWFIDAQPVIDFLKSGERNRYEWTDYTTRNYTNPEWTKYTDAWATRLVRRTEKTRFVGRVHEYIDPLPGKPKVLSAVVGHTGYIYADRTAKEAHDARNIGLLEKMMREDPDEPRWWLQLLQEYGDRDEYDRRRRLCRESLVKIKDKTGEGYDRSRGIFAAELIRLEREQKNWKAATEAYETVAKEKRYHDVAKAYMELDAAQAYFYDGSPSESEIHCHAYLKYYRKWHNREEAHEELMFFISETFEPHMWGLAACLLMYIEAKDGRWDAVDRYFDKAEWSDGLLYDFRGYEDKLLEVIETTEYDEHHARMLETFWKEGEARGVVQEHLGRLRGTDEDKYWKLVRAMMEAELPEPVPYDLKILWADRNGEDADFTELYRGMFGAINPLLLDPSLWKLANEKDVPLGELIAEVPFPKWRRYADYFAENAPSETLQAVYDEIARDGQTESEQMRYFRFRVMGMLIAASAGAMEESVAKSDGGADMSQDAADRERAAYQYAKGQIEKYTEDCLVHYRSIHSLGAMAENSVLLPDDCRIAICFEGILSYIDGNDYRSALTGIKDSIGICPEFDGALQAFSHLYSSVITKSAASSSASEEMKQLIDALQGKVDELVSAGMIEEAQEVMKRIQEFQLKA